MVRMMASLFRRKKDGEDLDILVIQGYLILDELSQANERWKKSHQALTETFDKMAKAIREDKDDGQSKPEGS